MESIFENGRILNNLPEQLYVQGGFLNVDLSGSMPPQDNP